MLEQIQALAKRKDFKPFSDKSMMQIVKPIRRNVRMLATILAHSEGVPIKQRVEYAAMGGIKLQDGANELDILYTEFECLEELSLILFELKREDVSDFDFMDEGEVNAGLQLFFMKRKGI
jgi:hypothetical protein